MATGAFFNLPFSIHLTKRTPVDSRFVVQNTSSLAGIGTAFAGLGPIWVEDEQWYYYFDTQTTYKRWPDEIGSGSAASGSEYLFDTLSVTTKGQESISIDFSKDSQFLLVENLIYKKDTDFVESTNGFNKYVIWNNQNGLLEPEDEIILVYKQM